jgi:hypothetical protein
MAPDTTPMSPEQRADVMWRVHPRELQDRGITRAAFYAEHIRAAIADALAYRALPSEEIERVRKGLDDAIEAIERASSTAPVVESLRYLQRLLPSGEPTKECCWPACPCPAPCTEPTLTQAPAGGHPGQCSEEANACEQDEGA